jgi:hypothetical protein
VVALVAPPPKACSDSPAHVAWSLRRHHMGHAQKKNLQYEYKDKDKVMVDYLTA